MAKHRTPLKLSDDERTFLFDFTRKGIRPAREIKRALVLFNSTDPTLDNSALAQRFGVSRATVENVQRHYRRGGLERALHEAPRSGQPKKIGSLGIAVGYPNILWSMNHYYPQEHPHDYSH